MSNINKKDLQKIYHIVNDKVLRWKIVAILDCGQDISLLFDDINWSVFLDENSHKISDILGGKKNKKLIQLDSPKQLRSSQNIIERWPISDYNYHWHYLDIEFKKLIERSESTWLIEYALIKLREDSGMTALKDKQSLDDIWRWLEDIGVNKYYINHIHREFFKNGLYYNEDGESERKERRVSLVIWSNKKLYTSITHDSRKDSNNNGGYLFPISSKIKEIIDILIKKWYYKDNIWEAIWFIVEKNQKDEDEEDDFDMV